MVTLSCLPCEARTSFPPFLHHTFSWFLPQFASEIAKHNKGGGGTIQREREGGQPIPLFLAGGCQFSFEFVGVGRWWPWRLSLCGSSSPSPPSSPGSSSLPPSTSPGASDPCSNPSSPATSSSAFPSSSTSRFPFASQIAKVSIFVEFASLFAVFFILHVLGAEVPAWLVGCSLLSSFMRCLGAILHCFSAHPFLGMLYLC